MDLQQAGGEHTLIMDCVCTDQGVSLPLLFTRVPKSHCLCSLLLSHSIVDKLLVCGWTDLVTHCF